MLAALSLSNIFDIIVSALYVALGTIGQRGERETAFAPSGRRVSSATFALDFR